MQGVQRSTTVHPPRRDQFVSEDGRRSLSSSNRLFSLIFAGQSCPTPLWSYAFLNDAEMLKLQVLGGRLTVRTVNRNVPGKLYPRTVERSLPPLNCSPQRSLRFFHK